MSIISQETFQTPAGGGYRAIYGPKMTPAEFNLTIQDLLGSIEALSDPGPDNKPPELDLIIFTAREIIKAAEDFIKANS